MAVKLHRCSNIWVKLPGHPCWKVQKALDEKGIDYELVKHRYRGDRDEMVELEGGERSATPVRDGSTYREESKQMAEKIRAGQLFEQRQATSASPS